MDAIYICKERLEYVEARGEVFVSGSFVGQEVICFSLGHLAWISMIDMLASDIEWYIKRAINHFHYCLSGVMIERHNILRSGSVRMDKACVDTYLLLYSTRRQT